MTIVSVTRKKIKMKLREVIEIYYKFSKVLKYFLRGVN